MYYLLQDSEEYSEDDSCVDAQYDDGDYNADTQGYEEDCTMIADDEDRYIDTTQ